MPNLLDRDIEYPRFRHVLRDYKPLCLSVRRSVRRSSVKKYASLCLMSSEGEMCEEHSQLE